MMNRLFTSLASFLYVTTLFAQSNFTPVSVDDIQEQPERWAFSKGLEVTLKYNAHAMQKKGSLFERRYTTDNHPLETYFEHDPRLYIKSTINRDVFFHLELGIDQKNVQQQNLREAPSNDAQRATLLARQVYLEYKTNPHNSIKIGRQEVELGAKNGKVFSGILTGATHSCRLGTWCYTLGAVKMSDKMADWIYYGSLRYPFYENDLGNGKVHTLTLETFRIDYNEQNIPLGISGAATVRNEKYAQQVKDFVNSGVEPKEGEVTIQNNARQVFDRDGNAMEYNAHRQKYFGFEINWQYSSFFINLDATALQGKRSFHAADTETGRQKANFGEKFAERLSTDYRAEESVNAFAIELETVLKAESIGSTFGLRAMYASGDEQLPDEKNEGNNIFRSSRAYYEIVPGSYQGTNFYFNGQNNDIRSGTGLGHSVSNTTLVGFFYRYELSDGFFYYDTGLFSLERNQYVLNNKGNQVKKIGIEWDNSFSFRLARNLRGEFEANFFYTDKAFTSEQQEVPKDISQQVLMHGVGRIVYQF